MKSHLTMLRLIISICCTLTVLPFVIAQSDYPCPGNPSSRFRYERKTIHLEDECKSDNQYKLVLVDEFEGNTLNTDIWQTFYKDVPPVDRTFGGALNLPENVVVQNGKCHLKLASEDPELQHTYTDSEGNQETLSFAHSSSVITDVIPLSESGCWRYGKFSIRAKIPDVVGTNSSFWFIGWPIEFDVFEFFDKPHQNLTASVVNWHLRCCSFTGDSDDVCNGNLGGYVDADCLPAAGSFIDNEEENLGDLSNGFHVYTFEWTPYKIEWSVDGEVTRTIYRYYSVGEIAEIDIVDAILLVEDGIFDNIRDALNFLLDQQSTGSCQPLTCSDIPRNLDVEVFEHPTWHNGLDIFGLNLIISTGYHFNKLSNNFSEAEMQVDWVKVWQKYTPSIEGPNVICSDENILITIDQENLDSYVWNVSSNLEIVSFPSDHEIIVQAINPGLREPAWVEADVSNPNTCHSIPIKLRQEIALNGYLKGTFASKCFDGNVNTVNFAPSGIYTVTLEEGGVDSWDWNLVSGTTSFIDLTGDGRVIDFVLGTTGVSFEVTGNGSCGSFTRTVSFVPQGACEGEFLIYPNPTLDYVNVESEEPKSFTVELYDKLFSNKIQVVESNAIFAASINLSNLPSDVYFIRIITDTGITLKQVVKQ
mgnify:CR=1 FL=1